METGIKVYKELSYITTYDDQVYTTTQTINELEKMVSAQGAKFLRLWNLLVAISSIKKIESKTADDIDNYIISIQNQDLKEAVRAELRKRKSEWKRINIAILQNIIEKLKSEFTSCF